jgi:glucose/arabinose dehydrogenase
MSRHIIGVIGAAFIAVLLAAPAQAQQAQGRGQAPAPAEKPPASQKQPPAEAPAPPGQPVNVKLDLTITEQLGPGEPAKKTVSLIVADRTVGSIRSTANNVRATLSVDANPQILNNGNIKVQLGVEYNPQKGDGPPTGSGLNQRIVMILTPGKPLVLSQAADPLSDRKITVEVRAEILK